jgi:hypothetical protein
VIDCIYTVKYITTPPSENLYCISASLSIDTVGRRMTHVYLLSNQDPSYWNRALESRSIMSADAYVSSYRHILSVENPSHFERSISCRGYVVIGTAL